MHREHMNVSISAAARGDKVAILTENLHCADGLAMDIEELLPSEYVEKISRANGRRAIYFHGGGNIHFISLRQSARGMSLDRVFVPIGTPKDVLADIIPALAASSDGVLTGYY